MYRKFNSTPVCAGLAVCDATPECQICYGAEWLWTPDSSGGTCVCANRCSTTTHGAITDLSANEVFVIAYVAIFAPAIVAFFSEHADTHVRLGLLAASALMTTVEFFFWTAYELMYSPNSIGLVMAMFALQVAVLGGLCAFALSIRAATADFQNRSEAPPELLVGGLRRPGATCPICLEEDQTDEWASLERCAHDFHEKCIAKWFLSGGLNCPVCRKA